MEKWKTIKSEPLVDSRWVKVRKDSVDLPNGQHIDDFYAISLNDAAAIVALDDAGNIVLKKEYRYCLDRDLIEVPAGGFERGEDGLTVAKRELLEETWLCFGRLAIYRSNGRKLGKANELYASIFCQSLPKGWRTES